MSRANRSIENLINFAGSVSGGNTQEVPEILRRMREEPEPFAVEVLAQRAQLARARQQCAVSAEAARKLEGMLEELLQGSALHCYQVLLREEARLAVVRLGGELRELPIHPTIDLEELRGLEPWDVLRVRENVVVGVCRDDPHLRAAAQGEIAEFRGYHDRARGQARVVRRGGEEEVVRLARSLADRELSPREKLVLHRSLPGFAIGVVPAEGARSRFEVPIAQIETRLCDLAGLDEIAGRLIEEILLRLIRADLSARFDLQPMRGALLMSYKPGMGKTALMRALARLLFELGQQQGFDVQLFLVKPNETKNLFHGEDARIVREDIWGAIRARQQEAHSRPLLQLLVLDEIDALGRRAGVDQPRTSAAEDDALQAFLVEMDGMEKEQTGDRTPARVLCVGMTNRPDRIDPALKRPGRFGDLVIDMPEIDLEGALGILSVYARKPSISWYLDRQPAAGVDLGTVQERILRPALARIFSAVVLRYFTDTQRTVEVTAGEILAGAHYMNAMRQAKQQAARRALLGCGAPAVGFTDVLESLIDTALSQAGQLEADRGMLVRELRVKVPVARVDAVKRSELAELRLVRAESA